MAWIVVLWGVWIACVLYWWITMIALLYVPIVVLKSWAAVHEETGKPPEDGA